MWCSAADTHLKLLDRVISGASFLTGGVWVWSCTSSIWGSIMYALQDQGNPLHPLYGAHHAPYLPVRVTHGGLIAHRYTYLCASYSCRTSHYRRTFIPLSVSLWNDLNDSLIRWCGTGRFQEQGQCLFIGLAARSLFVSGSFPFLFFHSMGCIVGLGSPDWLGVNRSLPACIANFFKIIITHCVYIIRRNKDTTVLRAYKSGLSELTTFNAVPLVNISYVLILNELSITER